MKKQTAVEWLQKKLWENNILNSEELEWFEQAKEMENKQREYDFNESRLTHPMLGFKHLTFEDYINTNKE